MTKTRACLTLAVALLAASAAGVAGRPGTAEAKANPIVSVKATHDKAADLAVVAGSPVVFTGTGKMAADDESPWLVFVWDFGDGATHESGMVFGVGGFALEDDVTHVFNSAGVYTVRLKAGHGPSSEGRFKFEKTTTIKVAVACAESAPGPKKCGPVRFRPFTGEWQFFGDLYDHGTLKLADHDGVVSGTLTYVHVPEDEDEPTSTTYWVVKGSQLKLGRGRDEAGNLHVWLSLLVDLKPASAPTATAARPAKAASPQLLMQLIYDQSSEDYRFATGAVKLPDAASPGRFSLVGRTEDKQASICTLLNAGRKTTKPGGLLAFTVAVQNEGPACLPTGRIGLAIEIEGATIVEQSIQPARVVTTGGDARHLLYTLESLGKGAKADGRAAVAFVVRTDDDAGEVKCRVATVANGVDAYTDVVLPTDRVICVPVERK